MSNDDKWLRDFRELVPNKHLFTYLFLTARSASDLMRLHDALPLHSQLLMGDRIRLREIWRQSFEGREAPSGGPRHSDVQVLALASAFITRLGWYYLARLTGGEVSDDYQTTLRGLATLAITDLVSSINELPVWIEIPEHRSSWPAAELRFGVDPDRGVIKCHGFTGSDQLDRASTQHLMQGPLAGKFYKVKSHFGGRYGRCIGFDLEIMIWETPLDCVLTNRTREGRPCLPIDQRHTLLQALRDAGLPVVLRAAG